MLCEASAPVWDALGARYREIKQKKNQDFGVLRGKEHFSFKVENLFFDFSRHHMDEATFQLLITLAQKRGLKKQIQALFSGEIINNTEQRPALHTALRAVFEAADPEAAPGQSALVEKNYAEMVAFAENFTKNNILGATGKRLRYIVCLGMGGSIIGPRFLYHALVEGYQKNDLKFYFISSIDPDLLKVTLASLPAEETLFFVISKTFTTQETLLNARMSKNWLAAKLPMLPKKELDKHFIAVTGKKSAAEDFGVRACFDIPPWVGGRYSIWSAVRLPLMLAIGVQNFAEFLKGARAMDAHFQSTPFSRNVPVISALLAIWYINFFHVPSFAILPYAHELRLLPEYLQQLQMESNGKQVTQGGKALGIRSCPTIWGGEGPNNQHAFMQLLHQGGECIPSEFILALKEAHPYAPSPTWLLANGIGQAEALWRGRPHSDPHKALPGGRPSTVILLESISPFNLGSLLAFYEHKTFVEAMIWGINPYDQWGVMHAKTLAKAIFTDPNMTSCNAFTSWIEYLRNI